MEMFLLDFYISFFFFGTSLYLTSSKGQIENSNIYHLNKFLQPCCSIDDDNHDKLVTCVNKTLVSEHYNIHRRLFLERGNIQPSLSIYIVTRMTKEIYDYSAYSYFVQTAYSLHRDYIMMPLLTDSLLSDYKYHRKLTHILQVFENPEILPDYVVWIDAGSNIPYI